MRTQHFVLLASANPDLLAPGGGASVPPLQAITAPMPNTEQKEFRYYFCTMSTASFHRPDGKKLPFLNHFLKTNIEEDIAYLEEQINKHQNTYIRRATQEEVNQAKLHEDPIGTIKESVKKELSIEELEKLLAERRRLAAAGANPNTDANKVGGVDPAKASNALKAAGVTQHASATGANTATLAAMAAGVVKAK